MRVYEKAFPFPNYHAMTNAVTVHAIERGVAPSNLPRNTRISHTVYLDMVILPPTPLHVGMRVEVNTLMRTENPGGGGGDWAAQKWYKSRPADIVGEIVGIRTMELAITEFVILNEVPQSLTKHAYLTVQHAEGITVTMDIWRRIARIALLPFLTHTRHVPIERGAVIVLAGEDDDDD